MSTPDAPDDTEPDELRAALNDICGPSIVVHSVTPAAEDFHARFSARSRAYVYAVLNSPLPDPWLAGTALHHAPPLDVDAMNEAAGHLAGPNDFRSFGRLPEPDASAERVLYELRCEREGSLIRVRARANAFIHQMVRSLVGTLITVGEGRRTPQEVVDVLAARDRAAAGPVAPPHGLCLVSVEYDTGWSRPLDPARRPFDRGK